MDSGNPLRNWLAAIMAVLPVAYLLAQWKTMPAKVALHFGADGKPDRYGGKIELLFTVIMVSVISIFTYLLITNVHKLDKKKFLLSASQKFASIRKSSYASIVAVCW